MNDFQLAIIQIAITVGIMGLIYKISGFEIAVIMGLAWLITTQQTPV